jgi:hypothetical protein
MLNRENRVSTKTKSQMHVSGSTPLFRLTITMKKRRKRTLTLASILWKNPFCDENFHWA